MRPLKKAVKQDLECAANYFGQVRKFFARTPCKSLNRVLFGIGDDQGNSVVVSVAWVGFHIRGDARDFKRLDDVHGTGNVTPLASTLLGLADISFTGHHYQSRPDGKTTVIAEAEAATGQVSDEVLAAASPLTNRRRARDQPDTTPTRGQRTRIMAGGQPARGVSAGQPGPSILRGR